MPVVLGDVERWLNLDTTLDDVDPLGPERFAVRAVNPAVNKVSEKNIDAIERSWSRATVRAPSARQE
jgi:putative SOS response-associated peptidase YedK